MIGENLLRYNKEQKFLIFDKETCHLNLGVDNYPWQCAWIIATQNKILEKNNHFLNWGNKLKISKGAALATGFDPYVIKTKGEDPKEVYLKFRKDLDNKDYIVVGHNLLNFDVYVERFWCEEIGEPHSFDYIDRLIDTNAIAKAIKKGIKVDKQNFPAWQYRLMGYVERGLKTNLGALAKEYQLVLDEARLHKADYDIEVNWNIFNKQIWQIEL